MGLCFQFPKGISEISSYPREDWTSSKNTSGTAEPCNLDKEATECEDSELEGCS